MTTLYNQGDALKAERIAIEARDIDPIRVKKGSHSHKIQFSTIRGSAFCIIELPFQAVQGKSKSK